MDHGSYDAHDEAYIAPYSPIPAKYLIVVKERDDIAICRALYCGCTLRR